MITFAAAVLAGAFSFAPASAAEPSDLKPWAGEPHPSFALDDLAGTSRALGEFRDRVVLVHFFATWCEPCRDEMTALQGLVRAMGPKPLAIVAVDVGEVDLRVRAFFEKLPVSFPVVLDRDRSVTKAWDVVSLPSTFILDPALRPKLFVEGDLDWTHPDILRRIESLMPAEARKEPAN